MTISSSGIDLITASEGLRLNAYQDSAGVWTIGYGHTATAKPGMTITKEQAEYLKLKDMAWETTAVNRNVKSNINQNQFDALSSFVFNFGEPKFKNSTLLKKVNNNPNDPSIRQEFAKWINAGGRVLAGLVTRRAKEADLYFSLLSPKKKLALVILIAVLIVGGVYIYKYNR